MDKFKTKYRIPSARASWWDYSSQGLYFITICTADRECLFGRVENKKMIYTEIGEIVNREWMKSFAIRKELFCDVFVIMPNHIHAILQIRGTSGCTSKADQQIEPIVKGIAHRPAKSISSFVAGFKSAATVQINQYRNTPRKMVWQTRFHDHIIRDDADYHRIANYIKSNPQNWGNDKFFDRKP